MSWKLVGNRQSESIWSDELFHSRASSLFSSISCIKNFSRRENVELENVRNENLTRQYTDCTQRKLFAEFFSRECYRYPCLHSRKRDKILLNEKKKKRKRKEDASVRGNNYDVVGIDGIRVNRRHRFGRLFFAGLHRWIGLQRHQLHQYLLHLERRVRGPYDELHISQILGLGADRVAQHRLRNRINWKCPGLHRRLQESYDENGDELFYRQFGSGRFPSFIALPSIHRVMGHHGNLVSRFNLVQSCAISPGKTITPGFVHDTF